VNVASKCMFMTWMSAKEKLSRSQFRWLSARAGRCGVWGPHRFPKLAETRLTHLS
jgi:hypothetical protein